MTNISKTIADKQLKELGVVDDKPVFVPSTKTVGELYDETRKPRRTTRRTKISHQPSLFRNEPWEPITGRNQGGFEKSPKTWAKDDVLAKLDEHGKAITEHGEHAIIPSKRFDAIVDILWTDLLNGMEQARLIAKPKIMDAMKKELSFFIADSYFKGKDGEYKDIISREVDDE